MKTRLFIAAMAAVAVIGCQKDIDTTHTEVADGQSTFLQVNLKAAGTMTKADAEAAFEYGLDIENAVKSVTFYFFTENGAAYVVQNQENYLTGNIEDWTAGTGNNIEEISGLTLVIKQHQSGELPAKMVTVLNAPTELKKTMSLDALAKALIQHTNTDGFVMSNSVYVDGEAVINATEITAENLFIANLAEGDPGYNAPGTILDPTKYPEAAANPVDIYVERVAVKVRVSGVAELLPVMSGTEEGATQLTDAEGNAVYAKVLGWDVTNNTSKSYALKQLSASYTNLGFTPWNNATFFRSYWANTTDEPLHNLTFESLVGKNLDPGYAYYHENTGTYNAEGNGVDVDDAGSYNTPNTTANQAPQLLVAAQLVKADGTPIQLAKWYGDLYTIEGLEAAMVKTVAHRIYVLTEKADDGTQTFAAIQPKDVTFYQVAQTTEDKRYEVKIKATDNTTYYDMNGTAYTTDEVNEILGAITPAQMWNDGYTYYYKNIAHFGSSYGMVRNHIYDIKVTSVSGFGTPVYDDSYVITPEITVDYEATNLAAQINILSWHVVSQDVVLGN